MSGKVFQGSHLTIPFTEEGTLKGLEIQGITEQETKAQVDGKVISGNPICAEDVNIETGKFTIKGSSYQESSEEISGTTVSGTTVAANDINISNGRISVYGNTEQETRSGKNKYLLPNTVTKNGLEYVKNNDGTFNINGTATANTDIYIDLLLSESGLEFGKKYTISSNEEITGAKYYIHSYKNGSWIKTQIYLTSGTKSTLTMTEVDADYVRFNINIVNGTVLNLNNIKLQVEEGTEATEWEPYGISPSTDYPSDIRNVGDNINLFNANGSNITYTSRSSAESYTINGANSVTVNSDGNITWGRISLTITNLLPNTKYSIRADVTNKLNCKAGFLVEDDNNSINDISTKSNFESRITFTTNSEGSIIIQMFSNWSSSFLESSVIFDNIEVKKDWIQTPYTPYNCGSVDIKVENEDKTQSKIVSFPFTEGQLLHKGDYLAPDGIHQKRKTLVLDGTENWLSETDLTNTIKFKIRDIAGTTVNKNQICSHFEFLYNYFSDTEHFYLGQTWLYFFANKTRFATIESWKAYLAEQYTNGTPVTIEYELAEELLIPYTSEQIEIFKQLDNCELFTPYTYLTTTNETKAELKMRYNYVPALVNPENPQVIRNLGDNINIFDISKNPYEVGSFNFLTGVLDNNDKTYVRTSTPIDLSNIKEKNITVSIQETLTFAWFFYKEDKSSVIEGSYKNDSNFVVIEIPENAKYLMLRLSTTNLNIMTKIQKGSISTLYTPYNCGSIDLKVENKNLANTNIIKSKNAKAIIDITTNSFKIDLSQGGIYSALEDGLLGDLNPNEQYTLSYKFKQNNNTFRPKFSFFYTDGTSSPTPIQNTVNEEQDIVITSELGKTIERISITWNTQSGGGISEFWDIQLEKGNMKTSFIEHQEKILSFPLSENQVLHEEDKLVNAGIRTNRRTVTITDETFAEYNGYAEIIEGGLIHWACWGGLPTTGEYWSETPIRYCNIFDKKYFIKWGTMNNQKQLGVTTYTGQIRVVTENIYGIIASDDANARRQKVSNWLKNNNVILEVMLDESTIVPYTEEQRKVFNEINKHNMFIPVTHARLITDIETTMDLKYNYAPAMPSVFTPSRIRNVGDNINLLNNNTFIKGYYSSSTKEIHPGTETSLVYKSFSIKLKKGNYILSSPTTFTIIRGFTDYNNAQSVTLPGGTSNLKSFKIEIKEDATLYISLRRSDNGNWLETDLLKLEENTAATPYSAHHSGNITINESNVNLIKINYPYPSQIVNDIEFIAQEENLLSFTVPANGNMWSCVRFNSLINNTNLIGKTITVSATIEGGPNAGIRLAKKNSGQGNDIIGFVTKGNPVTFTVTEDMMPIGIYFYASSGVTPTENISVSFSDFMVNVGETAQPYVPHLERDIVLPLNEYQFLHYNDYTTSEGIYQTRQTCVFDGTEIIREYQTNYWTDDYAAFYIRYIEKYSAMQRSTIYDKCSHFIRSANLTTTGALGNNVGKFYIHPDNGNVYFCVPTEIATTVEEFASWVKEQYNSGTPLTIEGVLPEPVITPYTIEQNELINNIPTYVPTTNLYIKGDLKPNLVVNTANFVPTPNAELLQVLNEEPNLGTRVNLEIWSHEDEFIDTLYNTDYEFEGQCIDPKITLNANGSKTLTLSLPLYIIDKKTREFVENPRWTYITQQYKIRVQQDDRINEFVLRDYTESHDANDQLMININAQSLEEFELSQIGYNITFNENSLYRYNTNEDPNDPDTVPIGTYEPDIHFWNEKLLENSDWEYRVESYYPIDREMSEDNRQITNEELEYKNGKEQFYEEDRIIDYTEENEPIYSEEYEIKKRVVKAEKSNIFNIVQDICEAFECWPTFEIQYKDGKIVKKTIVYKNDVPQDAMFSVNYQTNLNSIQRTVDSSQIVTKMYVTPIQNENVDNGIISISTNPKNFMKENYLLDLSWYLGDDRAETDIRNARLINPKIGMHFAGTNFSEPLFATTDTETTKDTIEVYKKNIRNRNTYIENMSLQLSKDQEELINLKTEREYVQSQKDAAQETVNTLIDEMSLIGNTELRKENKACYLYKQNDVVIIRFSEIGIKTVPNAETFNTPINILALDGTPFYEEGKVPAGTTNWKDIKTLQLVPYKVDPIIGTILECQVANATIGTSTDSDYASFKCSFDYDPYDYYKKLISYWNAKIVAATDRLNLLGKSREDGGNSGLIYDLETKVIEEKRYVFQAQQQKAQVVKEFESKFNPYIREGYWENTDFGIYMNKEQSKTYIPDEFKVLKYGQTEDSSSEETDKYDWSKDYVSFKIPNVLISNAQGGTAYLYNIIDIEEIEVMNDDPLNKNDNFRTYVKGTDYSLEYGYTSLTPNVTASDRGIYIRFYEPEVNTNNDYIPQFTANSQVYIRVKARGSNQYIWSGYSKAEYQSEGNETKRKWFCPLEQRISIDDKDIILSSIVVKANTSKVTYDNNNNLIIDNTQYELKYGKDYYTSKEIENGVTLSRITFYQTTNTPLMDFQYANYTVEYNQDITAKYYYNDALDVMKDSSIPQTTYSINVLDISEAENFLSNLKWYKPQVGTRVPIYDEELRFKGLVGFINSITFDLLNPQNTQLSITNFKDKFVDLFQKITASTIALQSKEYEYDRSTQIVTVEGGISKNVLKDTFERPDSNFTVTPNSNIKWDYSGITSTSDKLNENGVYAQLKVTPNGIFTANSKDEFGNYVWTTAITPQGINASQLTIGKLDTRQIQIFNSSEPRFMWNETGLYAYGQNEGKTDYETYVLYNENGIKFRQLMKSTNRVILPNIVKSPTFTTLSDWTLSSTDGSVFDTSNTGIVEEIEVIGASGVPTYQAIVASNKQTNNITFTLNSTKKDLVREHKYYFRVYVKANNIPELTNIDMNAGFTSFFKNIQYSQNNQYAKIDGFVTGVIDDNKFAINVTLPNGISNWSVSIKKPMILDVTEIFGETIPSLQWFSDLTDIVEEGSWETDLDVYGDALRLDWGGLRIGAQDNSLQLTSQDGLVIYHPITTETNNERRMRLQLGQWKEVAVDEFGNPITNGTELMYEDLYGLRALDNNGNMIFKVTQRGVEFDFTSNLEETIKNYSAEAALGAIASTNTSNLLKNSCGYVYDAEIVNGKETGRYKQFYDWHVDNINYLFPIDEKFTQKNADGSESSIVEGTVSKHAFKMGGDIATGARPLIKQTVDVATSEGVVQPFTLKFLMKGISNTQTSSIKNGIHLEITEAGNQDDISVDIPYIGNGNWQVVKYTIYTEMRQVTISISNISTITVDSNNIPTNGVIYLSDLMFTSGKDTPAWTVSPGEVYNNYVTIGSEGVIVTSEKDQTGSSVRTVMDSHSFRVETINADRDISTNIQVTGDSTTLGPTHIKGQCDIGAVSRLRFIENADLEVAVENRNPGVDITLIKGIK